MLWLWAFLFLVLALKAQSADLGFYDWLEPSQPQYDLLRRAAGQAGLDNWAARRLQQNERLPQATARMLAQDLEDSQKVELSVKQALIQAFPSEASQFTDESSAWKEQGRTLSGELDRLKSRIDALRTTRDKNNYSALSNPQCILSFSNFLYSNAYHQLLEAGSLSSGPGQNSSALDFTLAGRGSEGSYRFHFIGFAQNNSLGGIQNNPTGDYVTSPLTQQTIFENSWSVGGTYTLSVSLDPPWFSNLNLSIGTFNTQIDDLLFSLPGVPQVQPFFSNNLVKTENLLAPGLGQNFNGLFLEKDGPTGWWLFTTTKLIYIPAWQTNFTMDWLTLRLDMRGFDFGLLQDSNIWFTTNHSATNSSMDSPPNKPLHSDHDFGLGLQGQLWGAGLLSFEAAQANFFSQGPQPAPSQQAYFQGQQAEQSLVPGNLAWQDQAFSLVLSKHFPFFDLVASGQQIGPYFVTGQRHGLWTTNIQYGNYLDTTVDDPRAPGKISWQSDSRGADFNTNNSQKFNFQASCSTPYGFFGLSAGLRREIVPSGPWIQTARFLNNSNNYGAAGHNWLDVFTQVSRPIIPGTTAAQGGGNTAVYNTLTQGPALYQGQPVSKNYSGSDTATGIWNWDDLQQVDNGVTQEIVLLSQKGVGDFNLRPDSIKTLNSLRLNFKLDLQGLFHAYLPESLEGYSELRDTDESAHLARFTDQDLLAQSVTEVFGTFGVYESLSVLAYGGFERWLSRASAFPVNTEDYSAGIGFDLFLNQFINGMVFGSRLKVMRHEDLEVGEKDFWGWTFNLGSTITY